MWSAFSPLKILGIFIDLFSGKTEAVKNACKLYNLAGCKKKARKEGRKGEGARKDRREAKKKGRQRERISITIQFSPLKVAKKYANRWQVFEWTSRRVNVQGTQQMKVLAIDRQYNPKSPMILRRLVLHDFGDQNSASESNSVQTHAGNPQNCLLSLIRKLSFFVIKRFVGSVMHEQDNRRYVYWDGH